MSLLQEFITAVGKGKPPSSASIEAAAEVLSDMLAFGDYHRRQELKVRDDIAEAKLRNIDAAHDLVRRVLQVLQRPIARSQHHTVLVGGQELCWLETILTSALKTQAKAIELIPKNKEGSRAGGKPRRNRRRKLELYAATICDQGNVRESDALRMVAGEMALADGKKIVPGDAVDRDLLRKDLLPKGREALARRNANRRGKP